MGVANLVRVSVLNGRGKLMACELSNTGNPCCDESEADK